MLAEAIKRAMESRGWTWDDIASRLSSRGDVWPSHTAARSWAIRLVGGQTNPDEVKLNRVQAAMELLDLKPFWRENVNTVPIESKSEMPYVSMHGLKGGHVMEIKGGTAVPTIVENFLVAPAGTRKEIVDSAGHRYEVITNKGSSAREGMLKFKRLKDRPQSNGGKDETPIDSSG